MSNSPLEVVDFVFNNDHTFHFKIKVHDLNGSKVYTTAEISLVHHEAASRVDFSVGTYITPADLRQLANELESAMLRAESKLARGKKSD